MAWPRPALRWSRRKASAASATSWWAATRRVTGCGATEPPAATNLGHEARHGDRGGHRRQRPRRPQRLAMRGWQVRILETRAGAAQGASSTPAGAMHPLLARDDSLPARLTRAGFSRMHASLARLQATAGNEWFSICGHLDIANDADEEARKRLAAVTAELGFPASSVTRGRCCICLRSRRHPGGARRLLVSRRCLAQGCVLRAALCSRPAQGARFVHLASGCRRAVARGRRMGGTRCGRRRTGARRWPCWPPVSTWPAWPARCRYTACGACAAS